VLSLIRIVSFALTIGVAALAGKHFSEVVAIIATVHYVVALVYSKRQLRNALSKPVAAALTGALSLSSVAMYLAKIKVSFVFAPHHVFNEVYIEKSELFRGKENQVKWFIWSAVFLNAALYFAILGQGAATDVLIYSPSVTTPWLAVGAVLFLAALIGIRSVLTPRLLLSACTLELLAVAAIVIGQHSKITIWHIVMYHITMWGLYPLYKMWKPGNLRPACNYVGLTVALLVVSWLTSSLSILPWHMTKVFMREQFFLLSLFHIMSSVFLSKAQPEWIWRIFQPAGSFITSMGAHVSAETRQPQTASLSG
jgi:hypothetical protein